MLKERQTYECHKRIQGTVKEWKIKENNDKKEKITKIKNSLNTIKKECMRAFSSRQRIIHDANRELEENNLNDRKISEISKDKKISFYNNQNVIIEENS